MQSFFVSENLNAAIKKKKNDTSVQEDKSSSDNSSDSKTKIVSSKNRKSLSFFSEIDSSVLIGVENGSPSSIRQAMSKIRKSE